MCISIQYVCLVCYCFWENRKSLAERLQFGSGYWNAARLALQTKPLLNSKTTWSTETIHCSYGTLANHMLTRRPWSFFIFWRLKRKLDRDNPCFAQRISQTMPIHRVPIQFVGNLHGSIVSWARLWTICIAVKVCMIVFYEYIILGEKHADTLKSPVRFLLTTYRVKLGAWDITTDTTKPFLWPFYRAIIICMLCLLWSRHSHDFFYEHDHFDSNKNKLRSCSNQYTTLLLFFSCD